MILLNNIPLERALVYSAAILVMSNTGAQSATVESQLLSCASGATDAIRLVCYDGLAESIRASAAMKDGGKSISESGVASSLEPADSERPLVDPSTGVPLSRESEQPVARKTETFDTGVAPKQSIRVMIEKTKRNARGDWYFYFDNGEVWKQIDTRNRRIPPLPIAATLSRGIFSSHKLHIDGQQWSMKLRRVK